jgi:hypothetical protein
MVQAVRKVSKRLHIVAQREEFCDFFRPARPQASKTWGARTPSFHTASVDSGQLTISHYIAEGLWMPGTQGGSRRPPGGARGDLLVELRGFEPMAIAGVARSPATPLFANQCAQPAISARVGVAAERMTGRYADESLARY